MKTLFVVYQHATGVGNCTIKLNDEDTIESIEDVKNLQEWIAEDRKLPNVVITNMIMLPIG